MNYHNILHDDMRNGPGLRVTLFVSGCEHGCKQCQNPQTWNPISGIEFDEDAKQEIFDQLKNDYIDGITLSGGDPLYQSNLNNVYSLCKEIKEKYPNKTIWIYTGYTWEYIFPNIVTNEFNIERTLRQSIVTLANVLVDGKFEYNLLDQKYKWAGSTNQRIINVQESLKHNKIVLWED